MQLIAACYIQIVQSLLDVILDSLHFLLELIPWL